MCTSVPMTIKPYQFLIKLNPRENVSVACTRPYCPSYQQWKRGLTVIKSFAICCGCGSTSKAFFLRSLPVQPWNVSCNYCVWVHSPQGGHLRIIPQKNASVRCRAEHGAGYRPDFLCNIAARHLLRAARAQLPHHSGSLNPSQRG